MQRRPPHRHADPSLAQPPPEAQVWPGRRQCAGNGLLITMGIGAVVRRAAGPLEPALADGYRRLFFDIGDFAERLASLGHASELRDVVEIGCGEGALLSRLNARLPQTRFIGIDTSPALGSAIRTPTAGTKSPAWTS